eukprot:symbB.v1.2.001799.t1/scaffold97.1/size333048/3
MLPPRWANFPNEKDACCAWTLWSFLLVAYLCYAALSSFSLVKALGEPNYIDTSEAKMTKPSPSLDVCELLRTSDHLRYSLLGQIAVMSQTGWFLKNGTENYMHSKLQASETFYDPDGKFRCLRFRSKGHVPPQAEVTYYNFYVGVKEPVHPSLYRFGGQYIAGLVFRPSLAENATNPFALQEERLVRLYVPSEVNTQGYRNVVCSAIPTFAKWVDSLGGRMGAAGDDTFYFADMTLIPESLQTTSNIEEDEGNNGTNATKVPLRYTLKIGLPISTDLVRVKLHVNDVLKCIINWLGELTSATAVFKLITVLFPAMEQETFRLFWHMPWIGLGHASELDPLVKETLAP